MKRLILKSVTIFIILESISYSESNFSFHSHSFHLFSNPSLLVMQKGVPISTSFIIPSHKDRVEGKAAFSINYKNKAFALGYENSESVKNKLVAAYSLNNNFFYFGSSFSVLFDSHNYPELLLDAAGTFNVCNKQYISFILNNFVVNDSIKNSIYPQIGVSYFGAFPKIYRYLGFDFTYFCRLRSYKKKDIENVARVIVTGSVIESPLINYSIGYEVCDNNYQQLIIANAGLQIRIDEITAGLLCGIDYDPKKAKYKIKTSINFNPLNSDYKPSTIDILVKEGDEQNPGVYVSMKCSNLNNKIKNWVLVFSNFPLENGKILKSFSGGNIPPSTVYWDLRDQNGDTIDHKSIYIKAVISDRKNNISSTPWIVFNP